VPAAIFAGTPFLIGAAIVRASVAVRRGAGIALASIFAGTPILVGAPVTA